MVKRVALARALALEPELLLLDEPTAGLDPDRSQNFVELIGDLQRELGLTVVMVTHDLNTLAGLASHVAVLADHHILAFGTRAEIMTVDHPFVTGFPWSVIKAASGDLRQKTRSRTDGRRS
jgi:phospholipid/cholesterol/gamma-HCH transport system ATP-binding protein